MTDDLSSYAIALVIVASVYAVVFGLPRLLVRFKVISTAMPVVTGKRPIARDWVLTIVNLTGALVLIVWTNIPDVAVLVAAIIYLVAMPWWFWRSFMAMVYMVRNKNTLGVYDYIKLVFSTIFLYAIIYEYSVHGITGVLSGGY